MKDKWKTMPVEDKHISEGEPDSCVNCPIALAMKDYEPVFDNMKECRPMINTEADCWYAEYFGEDDDGAMSHRIIVHPDDRKTVERFIQEFDYTQNKYFDEPESSVLFAPFTFRYRVVDWKPIEIQGENK